MLNADILAVVTSFASRGTVSTMMQASRFFYHEGPKTILRDGVNFQNDQDVAMFLQFMRAEDGTRSRYLTGLSISTFDDEDIIMVEDSARSLAHFLSTSSFDRLKTLHIDNAELTFVSFPFLLTAFKTLSGIERLSLEACGPIACGLVDALSGRLRSVVLAYDVDTEGDHDEDPMAALGDKLHPLVLLRRSCDTLQSLDIGFADWDLPRSLYPPPFPHMRDLVITWCAYPPLLPYIHAFPNLRTLRLDTTYDERQVDAPGALTQRRQVSRVDQLQQGSWKSLDTVDATVADVYASGLTCRVRHLILDMQDESFDMLGDVLNDARPASISLHIARGGAFDVASGIPAVLRLPGTKGLEALELDFQLISDERDIDLAEAVEHLVEAVSSNRIPLKSLKLEFGCSDLPARRAWMRQGSNRPRLPQCRVERYLEDVQLDALGRLFLGRISTLEVVTLVIKGHRTREDAKVVVKAGEMLEAMVTD